MSKTTEGAGHYSSISELRGHSNGSYHCVFSLHLPVVLDLDQLCDICVQEERVRYLGKGYLLMLKLAAGFSYPLTQSATLGGRR